MTKRSYAKQMTWTPAVIRNALWTAVTMTIILLLSGDMYLLHAEGLEYGRFRISPALSIVERYSDNVYLSEDEEEDDFFTEITPELRLDFALASRNYITIEYIGNYFYYNTADNIDSENHFGELSWTAETAKGSRFLAGASALESNIQPYSPTETINDYSLTRYFAEMILVAGQVTEFGAAFERLSRRFDDAENEVDDYDRNQFDVSAVYRRSEILPLLLQYRLVLQDNQNDLDGLNRDYVAHSVFTGARWRPAGKLSGAFRIGYTWSDFDSSEIEEFSGLGMDIDVLYRFSEITRVSLLASRAIQPITTAERDTGTYYVLTSAGVRLSHQKWAKILTSLSYSYYHRDYEAGLDDGTGNRIDRGHIAGASIEYAVRTWISVTLGYQYRNNDSDRDTVDYEENLFRLGVRLSI